MGHHLLNFVVENVGKNPSYKMALQQLDITSSDIIPQKTLNDIDSMYYYLKQKLNVAKQMTDLIPFIKKLMNIKELKQHLDTALDKEYKSAEPESDINIRSLFVSLFSLNGIPSDYIHGHILSFLPPIEFKKLPLLSKHFKFICRNYQYLYNNMGYMASLEFSTEPHKLSNDSQTSINIYHNFSHWNADLGVNFSVMDKKNPSKLSSDDLNNLTISISHLKKWKIREEHMWIPPGMNLHQQSPLQDGHNKFMFNILKSNASKIEKLHIQIKDAKIIQNIFDENQTFDQCIAVTFDGSNDITLHPNTFKNIQCLEILSAIFGGEMTIENINSILKLTASSLKCFRYKLPNSRHSIRMMLSGSKKLDIPAGIEWCSIDASKASDIQINFSECDKLIGVQLMGIDTPVDNIKWPKQEISFVCIGVGQNGSSERWKNMIKDKILNIKSICLLEKKQKEQGSRRRLGRDYEWKFDDDEDMKRVNVVKALLESTEEEKCLLLDEESCDNMLFYRVLEYYVQDTCKRDRMLENCKRWWYLGSAKWMKNIAFISKSKS